MSLPAKRPAPKPRIPKYSMTCQREAGSQRVPQGESVEVGPGTAALPALAKDPFSPVMKPLAVT